jgi:two-component system, NtrC family, response regulator AtoC
MAKAATKELTVLLVDDERLIRWTLKEALRGWGYAPVEASDAANALALFDSEHPALTLLDINLPDRSGLEVLREIRRRDPVAVVIMITAAVVVENAVASLRAGAYDFVSKPLNLDELQVTIRNALEAGRMRRELSSIRGERARKFGFDQIVGRSPAMREMSALARKVAESEVSSVLLQGESGTGKDLVAKAIHYASRRSDSPFVAINCAAIPSTLIESELFGYEKGAFTDAKARKEGLFEQAEGGTLFLDEIGELELGLQAKLLRVLEEGTFRRVGGLKDIPLDVRVVAASNRDLKAESTQGRFREDLYYRLSVIQIDIPPLRERGDDVLLLAEHYLQTLGGALRRGARRLSPEVAEALRRYAWPGNVRELRNVIERVLILEEGNSITKRYLPPNIVAGTESAAANGRREALAEELFRLPPTGVSVEEVELSLVRQAMARSGGVQKRAAQLLGLSRDQLRYRLKKLDGPRA